jgi:hypothetical protein
VDVVKPWLLLQHPWLADIVVPANLGSEKAVMSWLTKTARSAGTFHEVTAMPLGMYVGREPIAELEEMVGKDRVLRVNFG